MFPFPALHNNITQPATWPRVHLIPPSVTVSFLIQFYFEGIELYNSIWLLRGNKQKHSVSLLTAWSWSTDPYFLLLLLCLHPRRDTHNLPSSAVAGSGAATSQLSSSLSPPSVAVGISAVVAVVAVVVLWWPSLCGICALDTKDFHDIIDNDQLKYKS